MATGSKYETKRRGIITAPLGDYSVAFGPKYIAATEVQVIRVQLIEPLDGEPRTLTVALPLDRARELRNALNAIIGLIVEDAKP
jgi:hypothetical protein